MKNVTKKQMITLIVLIGVLIMVIAVQYFYRPVINEKNEYAKKVQSMTMVYDDMKMIAAYYSIDAVSYKEAKAELAKKRSDFLPLMKNSQQDDMITNMLVASNISIESSEISDLVTETINIECAVDKEQEESADGVSTMAMYPEGGKVVTDEGDYVVLQYETGECTREIYYNVSGRYEDIIGFLKKVYDQKSMEISQFYFNSGNLDSLIAADQPENPEEYISEDGTVIPTIGSVKKTQKVISNTIYKAGIGIKVHMYDRDFDLISKSDF